MSNQTPLSPWQRAVAVLEDAELVGSVVGLFTLKDLGILVLPDGELLPEERMLRNATNAALVLSASRALERRLLAALGLPSPYLTDATAPEGQETAARP